MTESDILVQCMNIILTNVVFSTAFREKEYDDQGKGSYVLFFRHNSKRWAVDATEDDGSYGRLINHSALDPNVVMKTFVSDNAPVIIFMALKDIPVGQEIQYVYGESRKDVWKQNPWLAF